MTGFEDLGHRQLKRGNEGSDLSEPIRIMQITDLHHFPKDTAEFDLGEGKYSVDGDRYVPLKHSLKYSTTAALAEIEALLVSTRPHLVVLTGDIIDGRAFRGRGSMSELHEEHDGWRRSILEVLEPIVAAGCAWTWVPGNHDDDCSPWSREDLLGIYKLGSLAPGCISEGATSFDHTVTVGTTAEFVERQSLRLWLFDSGGNHDDPKIRYHTFGANAVQGYRKLSARLPLAGCELAYFHIPLPQIAGLRPVKGTAGLFDSALNAGMVPHPWNIAPLTSLVRLMGRDRVVGSSKLESGMFDALVEQGKVRACFFGHDHSNDAVYIKENLYMIYGRVGASTPPKDWEGKAGPLPFSTGARVVEFESRDGGQGPHSRLTSWIQLPSGKECGSAIELDRKLPSGLNMRMWNASVLFACALLVYRFVLGSPG